MGKVVDTNIVIGNLAYGVFKIPEDAKGCCAETTSAPRTILTNCNSKLTIETMSRQQNIKTQHENALKEKETDADNGEEIYDLPNAVNHVDGPENNSCNNLFQSQKEGGYNTTNTMTTTQPKTDKTYSNLHKVKERYDTCGRKTGVIKRSGDIDYAHIQ